MIQQLFTYASSDQGGKVGGAVTDFTKIGGPIKGLIEAFGRGDHSFFRQLWPHVPIQYVRLEGGHGWWTDTLTGERMPDKGSDTRRIAVVASAIGMYVDSNNIMYFPDGRVVEPADSSAAWIQQFGAISFEEAYRQDPAAFRIYGSSPAGDPVIGSYAAPRAGTRVLPVPTFVPPALGPRPDFAPPLGAPAVVVPAVVVPAALAPPQSVAGAPALAQGGTLALAGMQISPMMLLAIAAVVLLIGAGMLARKSG